LVTGSSATRTRNGAAAFTDLRNEALETRRAIVSALHWSGGGHFGGALSVVDIIVTLHHRLFGNTPDLTPSPHRDRLIFSKGHACIALYATLERHGVLSKGSLAGYSAASSELEGHPDMTTTPGIDFSTGSLGQGLAVGIGMALAMRPNARVWVVLGDGELQEGSVWEAASLASRYALTNLHAIVDANGYQEFGWQYDKDLAQTPVPNLRQKWEAFGWQVLEVNGHDHVELQDAYTEQIERSDKPSVILAYTRKGFGCASMEADPARFHCASLTTDEFHTIMEELGRATM
jgi:transketolase